jgi:hypothetical protein
MIVHFGPNVSTVTVDASPSSAYADGVYGSQITVTVKNTTGGPMNNVRLSINPPTIGSLGCCSSAGCGCYNVHTDSNGQFKTSVYSTTIGAANVSAYVEYAHVPASGFAQVSNFTIVTFKPPPATAALTASPGAIDGDGVNRSLITAKFKDAFATPTPGISVTCNVSNNSVFFPTTNLVTDSNGAAYTNMSSTDNPATIICYYIGGTNVLGNTTISVNGVSKPGNYSLIMTSNKMNASAGSNILVTANVTNLSGGGVPAQSTWVSFATSYGGSLSATLVKTDSNGLASVNATAIGPGNIFVKANVSGDFGVIKLGYT